MPCAALAALLCSSAGCITGFAAYLGLDAASGSGSSHEPPPPPSLDLSPWNQARSSLVDASGHPSATTIRIDYRIVDASSGPVSCEVRWRLAAEPDPPARPATPGPGSQGPSGLSTSPDPGAPHFFVWNAGADLAALGLVEEDVVVRLIVTRGDGAASPAREGSTRVGNRAPAARVSPASAKVSNTVLTTFNVADSAGDATTLVLTGQAQSASGTATGPLVTIPNQLLSNATQTPVPAPPQGADGGVVWDSVAAFGFLNASVRLTLTATDLFGLSSVTTTVVDLQNDLPPIAHVVSVGLPSVPLRGRIPVTFSVTDPEALLDPAGNGRVNVVVDLSVDLGRTFSPATGLALGEGPFDFSQGRYFRRAGVFPDLATGRAVFLWDSTADLGATEPSGVAALLRLAPVNTLGGEPASASIQVQSPISFEAPATLFSGGTPGALAVADFTGDGLLDIAVTDAGLVRLLRNRGFGSFDPSPVTTAATGTPDSVLAADVTGDGIRDLIVASESPDTVTVLRGHGDGTFDALTATAIPAGPHALAILDLTGDGVPDVAVTNEGAGSVSLLRGLGDGTFVLQANLPAGADPRAILLLDVTGDRIPDIVVANDAPGAVSLLRGLGQGQFSPPGLVFSDPGAGAIALGAADWNGDGIPDIVVLQSTNNTAVLLLGRGDGGFSPESVVNVGAGGRALALADFTGGGLPQIVTASFASRTVGILSVRSQDLAPAGTLALPYGPVAVAAGDVAGDGGRDIVVAAQSQASSRVSLQRGRGDVSLDVKSSETGFGGIAFAAAGDWNGDGIADLAVGVKTGNTLRVLLGQSDGTYVPVAQIATPQVVSPDAFVTAYLDGDATLDMAVTSSRSRDLRILLGDGTGQFALAQVVTVAASAFEPIAAADLNGDGATDLVFGDGSSVGVLLGSSTGLFTRAANALTLPVPGIPSAIVAADLNGDGIPDLLVGDNSTGSVHVLLGRGDASFDEVPQALFLIGNQAIAVADLTGDGIPDIALVDGISPIVRIGRGRGDGRFDLVASVTTGANPLALAVATLAGDGIPQLLVAENHNDALGLLRVRSSADAGQAPRGERGGGGRRYPFHTLPIFGTQEPDELSVVDVTHDGIPDVVCEDPAADVVNVLATSNGAPSRALALFGASAPVEVAAEDLRVIHTAPLDPALGEPGLVSTPTAGQRLRPASLASTVCPDTVTFASDFLLTLPLFSALTGRELEGAAGAIHVYRYERNVQGKRFLPYRPPLAGRIVEVASTAPDGVRPAFVAAATVSATSGTISFPVRRLGTFQSFIEVPTGTATLLRETFDDDRGDGALVSLPQGWVASNTWQVGPPTASAGPSGPASLPNVLGTNLRGAKYRPNADDSVTTPAIPIGTPSPLTPDRHVVLRFREWARLGTGDSRSVEIIQNGSSTVVASTMTSTGPGNDFVDVQLDIPDPLVTGPDFRIRFRLVSNNDGSEDRGWYIDDVDVVIEP